MNEIDGVKVIPLKQIPDSRGTWKEFVYADTFGGEKFAQCYCTTIYKSIIKGWHGYYTKTINYSVPSGMVKLVLYDGRAGSETEGMIQEVFLGDMNHCQVIIPPGVFNAFQGIADMSVIVVIADEVFSEIRTARLPIETDKIPYDWSKINK